MLTSSKKNFASTSRSGIVPAIAPQMTALFPTFFPRTASPAAAPRTICVIESNYFCSPILNGFLREKSAGLFFLMIDFNI